MSPEINRNDRPEDESVQSREPGTRSDAPAPLVACPPFRPDAVSLGPFDEEPFALQPITWRMPDGNYRPGSDNVRCLSEWLTGALDAAGVTLGAFDRLQVHLIATDGWGPTQTVAGWITRARNADPAPGSSDPPTDPSGAQDSSSPDPPGPGPSARS